VFGKETYEGAVLVTFLEIENSSFVEQIIDDFARQAAVWEAILAA
jgi:hypothetical protein